MSSSNSLPVSFSFSSNLLIEKQQSPILFSSFQASSLYLFCKLITPKICLKQSSSAKNSNSSEYSFENPSKLASTSSLSAINSALCDQLSFISSKAIKYAFESISIS